MKTWRWILLLLISAIIGVLLSKYLLSQQPASNIAGVYSDGKLVFEIAANDPISWHEYAIPYGEEYNIISVDLSGIKIVSASCPDELCIKQGYLGAAPIVCLPNRLIIRWITGADSPYDAVAG
jgi:hypothetical protein